METSRLLLDLPPRTRTAAAASVSACPRIRLVGGSRQAFAELPDAAIYVVERGVVVVNEDNPQRRAVLVVAGPGDVLLPTAGGRELAALVDAEVTAVTRDAYRALLADPQVAVAIADGLVSALLNREESLALLTRSPHVERVRAKLLQLARLHGKVVSGGVVIDVPLTHDLLADMVGSARETVTWAMRQLTDEGFVSREGGAYRLAVAPAELAARM